MKGYVKFFNDLPLILKVILALPGLDVLWVIYRICKSGTKNDTFWMIIGIILLIVGLPWLWFVDILTLLFTREVIWFS